MYDFTKVEEKTRNFWKKNKAKIEKSIQNDNKKKLFSFLEGPPTANAPPALHHLEVRTYKDIINKFRFMQGFSVPRKGGWDCHGLPVEVQVEKELGLKSKKDVVQYGTDKFIEKARKSVFSYIKEWEKSTIELGYWIDLKNPYITLDNNYIESVWWSLKELYKKGVLYEGYKVVPFCPRCGTPLSSHEVALGYKDIKEESVYIAFKIKGKNKEYILAWTTTPWTLPGNVALAVGNDLDYVKVELEGGDKVLLSRDRLNVLKGNYKILEKLKGKDLVEIEYEPLFDIKETQNAKSHRIIPANFVTVEEGTGIVHTAVMYGEDDYNVGVKIGLPEVHTVGEDGKFLDIALQFKGKFVKDAEKEILEELRKKGLLYKTEKIMHSYPFCWRCDSILLYYAINSWFVKVSSIRNRLVELNKKINWEPKHIKDGRFGKWLEGAKDWALSRSKFWGTPLPVWKCDCGKERIIGSVEELKKYSIKKITGKIDLHKPGIDDIKLKCECGKEMTRVSDVIDCWYDSGAASFAQFHYPFENKKEFEKRFPYDFVAEAIDQTRGWFYTLHVLAAILFDKPAYKNVICAGHVVDEKGEKMSKSKGNIIVPKDIIEKSGVDAVRLQFCTSDSGNQKRFSYGVMKEIVLPFLNVLYNTGNYYSQLESKKNRGTSEDKWILSKLNSLIEEVTKNLENYVLSEAFLKIQNFVVNDFSRDYIKITRDREDTKEIVKEVLEKISLLLAPFAPYLTEHLYSKIKNKSVHLCSWPKVNRKKIDKKLEKNFELILQIIEKGLAERDKAKIGLRWPLAKAIVISKNLKLGEEEKEIISNQLNVKEIEFKSGEELKIELDTKINPELEAEGYARELSRKVQDFRKKIGLEKKNRIELYLIIDGEFNNILEKNLEFIAKRTNASKIKILDKRKGFKEKFKNKTEFIIKDKKGEFAVIVT
ncbi:isoleucine--tRNA ligase [Candidatus Pacearchaeota archaeon]|nr:isoleucine--tRNA ligase [Candidatus Pacearchaeota archaeon]